MNAFVLRVVNGVSNRITAWRRQQFINKNRKRLRNTNFSIISSNCNGSIVCSDLGVPFNSPFVNLFMTASDYIKLLEDFQGYMAQELRFVQEEDPFYGKVTYPTAYLGDVKIYFMHYASEGEARDALDRRKKRINMDNLFIMFTDRSGCTQADLERFDRLPYKHKLVLTHVPHPEIQSAFYIKGFENESKVPVTIDYVDARHPVKRIQDQFDFVSWLND